MNPKALRILQEFKRTEFQRFVAAYIARDHNPAALENRKRLPCYIFDTETGHLDKKS